MLDFVRYRKEVLDFLKNKLKIKLGNKLEEKLKIIKEKYYELLTDEGCLLALAWKEGLLPINDNEFKKWLKIKNNQTPNAKNVSAIPLDYYFQNLTNKNTT